LKLHLVSVTGPESTGKSSLAEALAGHYNTVWVREYAREYLAGLDRPYGFEDIARIARGQLKLEKKAVNHARRFLFCDTDLLVCKIWGDFKYGNSDPWVEKMTGEHKYDLYLLCNIDLPWADDPLREHPHRRQDLMDLYIYELNRLGVSYEIVSGTGKARLDHAISLIEKTFMENIP
jgi:NadR type nicotinamide-nucleotide adenylyltransferase